MMTQPKWLLQAEGAGILLSCAVVYGLRGYSWWLFFALFLVPDVSMIGYLRNARVGARLYNLVHTEVLPLAVAVVGILYRPRLVAFSLIWLAHIGFDRMLGFGLKYPTGFGETHLARV